MTRTSTPFVDKYSVQFSIPLLIFVKFGREIGWAVCFELGRERRLFEAEGEGNKLRSRYGLRNERLSPISGVPITSISAFGDYSVKESTINSSYVCLQRDRSVKMRLEFSLFTLPTPSHSSAHWLVGTLDCTGRNPKLAYEWYVFPPFHTRDGFAWIGLFIPHTIPSVRDAIVCVK